MSLYRSQIGESWSLKAAVDALAQSARRAGKPGWIWIAGIAYPVFLVYGWELVIQYLGLRYTGKVVWGNSLPGVMAELMDDGASAPEILFFSSMFILVSLPLCRLAAGLARVCSSASATSGGEPERRPGLGTVWRAGEGLTLSTCGLQIQVLVMFFFAAVLCAGPAFFLIEQVGIDGDFMTICIASPVLLLLAVYGVVLSTLIQLALHSLAQNRRGIASAMLHSWRLLRQDAWATARTIAVDGVLIFATAIIMLVAGLTWFSVPISLLVLGFAGVTRAAYWAQAYRALGGLSPEDGMPGLAPDAGLVEQFLAKERGKKVVSAPGIEPGTYWLKASCSTD